MFTEVYTTIIIKDMKKAKTFYTELLGFKIVEDFGEEWIGLETAGTYIGLHPSHGPITKGGNLSIGFTVKNLDTAMQDLKKKGITFTDKHEDKAIKIAHFTDPDGTQLYLCELLYK